MMTEDERIWSKKREHTQRGGYDSGKNGGFELFLKGIIFPAEVTYSSNINTTSTIHTATCTPITTNHKNSEKENRGPCFPECHVFLWGLLKPGSLS